MVNVFGDHRLEIPLCSPLRELLAQYRERNPGQDRHCRSRSADVASASASLIGPQPTSPPRSKRRASRKGSRVLLLSDENLEKLLIWFGVWRLGAVVCPLNIEINEKLMADLATAVDPALIALSQGHRRRARWSATARRRRMRFGAWSAGGDADPQDEFFPR